jgi:hypothetical protein
MAEGYQREIGLFPSKAIDTTRLIGRPAPAPSAATSRGYSPCSGGPKGEEQTRSDPN